MRSRSHAPTLQRSESAQPSTGQASVPQLPKSAQKTFGISSQSAAKQHRLAQSPLAQWVALGKTALWVLFWLTLIDIGINHLFAYPEGNERTPNTLERYFNYGRSTEGKLQRMVQDTVENSAPILEAGWIDPQDWRSLPSEPKDDNDLLMAVYGMSFSYDISTALSELDNNITLRRIGAPSAPPSHSYAAYLADEAGRNADVVMMGVLASSIKRMRSVSGMSWNYEHPAPYTYPHYHLNSAGELVATEPAISTAADFVSAFNSQSKPWQHLQQQMAEYDSVFDPAIFNENWTDKSSLFRLIRRGWANRTRQRSDYGIYDTATGFNPEAPEMKTLEVMLTNFVATARAADQLPIILIISDPGFDNSLYEILSPHLQTLDALSLSTYELVPTDNPDNFMPDTHLTPAANRKVASALQEMIASAKETTQK
ncbi:MAG: hypothetical protein AAF703_08455 [Cyanobacteria bacterium P01_D01_bin.105]